MEKVNFWKLLGTIGMLSEEVNIALAGDNKVDAVEIVNIGKSLVNRLNLPMTEESMRKLDLVILLMEEIVAISADKKITVKEIISLSEKVCLKLGIELDKTGFSF